MVLNSPMAIDERASWMTTTTCVDIWHFMFFGVQGNVLLREQEEEVKLRNF